MRSAAALAAALVAIAAAGCGGEGVAAPVATTEVSMAKSYRFDPRVIEVDAGATVTWRNDDNFTHNVKLDGEDEAHEVERGDEVSLTFEKPGTYRYVCTLHPRDMDGEVIVR